MNNVNDISYDIKPARKAFSRIGIALSVILIVATVFQVLWGLIPALLWGEDNWWSSSSWGLWLSTFAPIYLIAVPIGLLLLKGIPGEAPQQQKLGMKQFWVFLLMAFPLMYGGNIIGTVLSAILSGGSAENTIVEYAMDNNPLKLVVMVCLAPLIEEYVFRKQIIDRTRKYGEKTAVFLSALTFGLFHLNLFQFFYAFGLGLLFAYLYTRTGRLRYPVLIHCIVNFMGSVVAPWVLSLVDLEALTQMDPNATTEQIMTQYGDMLPGLLVYMLYAMLLMGLAVAGLVLLIIKCRKLVWKEAEAQLPKGMNMKAVYINIGMIVYILLCLSMIILAIL